MENYNRNMDKILSDYKSKGQKPKVLLHACCAPCASSVIERLKDFCQLTVYFYNPNIDGVQEYLHRADELKRLCDAFKVDCVITAYSPNEFYSVVTGLEQQPEGGKRCAVCFDLRLKNTADYAKQKGFDAFATTLTVSPLKDAQMLNSIGNAIGQKAGVRYLESDFKKKNGYLKSIELSKQFNLYRQNYCGCEYSKRTNP